MNEDKDQGWSIWEDGKYHHRVEVDGKIYVDGTRVHPPITWQERFTWLIKDLVEILRRGR